MKRKYVEPLAEDGNLQLLLYPALLAVAFIFIILGNCMFIV